jgi:hypothetical protein
MILVAKCKGDTDAIIFSTRELAQNYRHINEFYLYYAIQSFLSVGCFDEGQVLLNRPKSIWETYLG